MSSRERRFVSTTKRYMTMMPTISQHIMMRWAEKPARLPDAYRENSLFQVLALRAGGKSNVLMQLTALVTHPCKARPLAWFSKARTSAGYRACRGVQPLLKNTMTRTARSA
jgi:hypothetical protein